MICHRVIQCIKVSVSLRCVSWILGLCIYIYVICLYTNLSWVDVEYFGSICTSDGHKPWWVHLSWMHTFLPDNWHSIFYTIYTVWNLAKIILAESLLTGGESAVVTPSHLKNITDENIKRQIWSTVYSGYACLTVIHNLIIILWYWLKNMSYLTSSYLTL